MKSYADINNNKITIIEIIKEVPVYIKQESKVKQFVKHLSRIIWGKFCS
jgi:hypothetical protein